jgi:hypothetical protein
MAEREPSKVLPAAGGRTNEQIAALTPMGINAAY